MNKYLPYINYVIGLVVMWGSGLIGMQSYYYFPALFVITLIINFPKYSLEPLSLFFAYYGIWYILGPMAAEIFDGQLGKPEYLKSIAMVYTVFGAGVLFIKAGTKFAEREKVVITNEDNNLEFLKKLILPLYIVSTTLVILIVHFSGGFQTWIESPGNAFLNRSGTGIYVVLSHFSTTILACVSGYYAYMKKTKLPVIGFLAWLMLTSFVHGSKFQIILFLVVMCIPWLKGIKIISSRSLIVYIIFSVVSIGGLILRSPAEYDLTNHLNYFNTLELLATSVKDFGPSYFKTFFLPFNKFLTPFGLNDPKLYYDMNHMLTDMYFPETWRIRATQQWPVETDLYLNFKFFLGIPVVGLFLFAIGFLYGKAKTSENLGYWFVSVMMTIGMISHLRGSLISHIDFYMYPFIVGCFFFFKKYSFDRAQA